MKRKLTIDNASVELPRALEAYIESKVRPLLAWNWRRIARVNVTVGEVRFSDERTKHFCRVHVELVKGRDVETEQIADELKDAIAGSIGDARRDTIEAIGEAHGRSLGMLF